MSMNGSQAALDLENKVLIQARINWREHKMRKGPALMKALQTEAPQLYTLMHGSAFDCTTDNNIAKTMLELGFSRKDFG